MKYRVFTMVFIFISVSVFGHYLFPAGTNRQTINQWLLLGPVTIPAAESELLKSEEEILNFNHIPVQNLRPVSGDKMTWTAGQTLRWRTTNQLRFNSGDTQVVYLAVYLQPTRWFRTQLVLETDTDAVNVSVFLDGESISSTAAKDKITAPLDLAHEKHLLLVKGVLSKGKAVTIHPFLEHKDPFKNEAMRISLTPRHPVNTENILNMINVNGTLLSPDGNRAAVSLSRTDKETGKTGRWNEILDTSSGKTVLTSENLDGMSNLKWLSNSREFSYTKTTDDKTSILQYDLNTHRQHHVLKDVKNFADYWWAPDNSFLIYSVSHPESNKEGYKYVKGLPDRSRFSDARCSMFIYYPGQDGTGVNHRLGDNKQNFSRAVISPDSRKVLLLEIESDYKNRPYFITYVHLLDVKSFKIEKMLETNILQEFMWAPDSRRLLVLGGPSAFGGLGKNLAKDKIPNEYDNQAYIYDPGSKKAEAVSKNFDPSIDSASWSSSAGTIYLAVTDKSYARIYKYSTGKKTYRMMNTTVDVARSVSFAREKNIAVFWGSGVTTPYRLYKLNLSSDKVAVLKDYNQEAFRDVTLGKYENWDYKTKDGKTVMGRIYYPVDFNRSEKYPCIVYYYGGTSPVTRDFGGRYPKNWYAANGYIVYVLQPTGATGFGQEASAVHVNDWGVVTSEEIVAAVKELTRTHSFIDAEHVGAMGASYGGFMTMYLATKTDVFAAYISHAGISSLSSYWGVGDWGYTYSGFATAGSFPWNRKDIYVGQSPLFLAERIEKPLLLLHGDTDNNVPPGESYQMFAALKLLNKEVALITFAGQQHFILEYKKRLRWMRTIIAWWDKYLKNQPEHWDHMYKE